MTKVFSDNFGSVHGDVDIETTGAQLFALKIGEKYAILKTNPENPSNKLLYYSRKPVKKLFSSTPWFLGEMRLLRFF